MRVQRWLSVSGGGAAFWRGSGPSTLQWWCRLRAVMSVNWPQAQRGFWAHGRPPP